MLWFFPFTSSCCTILTIVLTDQHLSWSLALGYLDWSVHTIHWPQARPLLKIGCEGVRIVGYHSTIGHCNHSTILSMLLSHLKSGR